MKNNNNNGPRALAEDTLAGDGLNGPFGLMKFTGAKMGQGWWIDGESLRISAYETGWNGTVTAVRLQSGTSGLRLAVGQIARFGDAALYIDPRPFWKDRVDLIAIAPRSLSLVRLISGGGTASPSEKPDTVEISEPPRGGGGQRAQR